MNLALTAKDLELQPAELKAPSGSDIVLAFVNEDQGVPHGLALYRDAAHTVTLGTAEVIVGPAHQVFQIAEGIPNLGNPTADAFEKALRAKYDFSLQYPRAVNEMRMFAAAAEKAKSLDPVKVAAALEGMEFDVYDGGKGTMRKDDHQFFQPMYIASFGERTEKEPFDEEKTGWGWKLVAKIDTPQTVLPTTCKMDRP